MENKELIIDKSTKLWQIKDKEIIKIKELENNIKELDIDMLLKDYTIEQLEEYLYFRKILEYEKTNNDEELQEAMNIVKNKIIKKLIKKR